MAGLNTHVHKHDHFCGRMAGLNRHARTHYHSVKKWPIWIYTPTHISFVEMADLNRHVHIHDHFCGKMPIWVDKQTYIINFVERWIADLKTRLNIGLLLWIDGRSEYTHPHTHDHFCGKMPTRPYTLSICGEIADRQAHIHDHFCGKMADLNRHAHTHDHLYGEIVDLNRQYQWSLLCWDGRSE